MDDVAGFSRHDVRNHDARGVGFERQDEVAVAALLDTDDAVGVVGLSGENLPLHDGVVGGDMLLANPDAVETGHGRDFSGAIVGEVVLEGKYLLAGTHFVKDDASTWFAAHVDFLGVGWWVGDGCNTRYLRFFNHEIHEKAHGTFIGLLL